MKIKTSELTDTALDWVVGTLELVDFYFNEFDGICRYTLSDNLYSPSEEWAIGGPIIEREGIAIQPVRLEGNVKGWQAVIDLDEGDFMVQEEYGPTPLIAAMRCYVASKLGDEVEVPDELIR